MVELNGKTAEENLGTAKTRTDTRTRSQQNEYKVKLAIIVVDLAILPANAEKLRVATTGQHDPAYDVSNAMELAIWQIAVDSIRVQVTEPTAARSPEN